MLSLSTGIRTKRMVEHKSKAIVTSITCTSACVFGSLSLYTRILYSSNIRQMALTYVVLLTCMDHIHRPLRLFLHRFITIVFICAIYMRIYTAFRNHSFGTVKVLDEATALNNIIT